MQKEPVLLFTRSAGSLHFPTGSLRKKFSQKGCEAGMWKIVTDALPPQLIVAGAAIHDSNCNYFLYIWSRTCFIDCFSQNFTQKEYLFYGT